MQSAFASATAEGGPIQMRCELNADCTLSGHWWVDVDALEAGTPGQWANESIDIVLIGHTASGPAPTAAWYSLRAHAVKK